jgi:hypothetical protein
MVIGGGYSDLAGHIVAAGRSFNRAKWLKNLSFLVLVS